jgi:hypothetical protein
MRIRMDVEGTPITATLADNETSRDFVSLLPLTLTLKDYAATEKISDLPRKLSTSGAPPGGDPSIGDITYYAPWGNLVVFYRDFGYSTGLVKLGAIDSNIDALKRPGPLRAAIDLLEGEYSSDGQRSLHHPEHRCEAPGRTHHPHRRGAGGEPGRAAPFLHPAKAGRGPCGPRRRYPIVVAAGWSEGVRCRLTASTTPSRRNTVAARISAR